MADKGAPAPMLVGFIDEEDEAEMTGM